MNPRNLSSLGEQAFEKGSHVLAGINDVPANVVIYSKLYSRSSDSSFAKWRIISPAFHEDKKINKRKTFNSVHLVGYICPIYRIFLYHSFPS